MNKRTVCLLLLGVLTTSLGAASIYRPAKIESVQREWRTEKQEALHNTFLDSMVSTTKELVYLFKVRCGNEVYSSEYIYPGKPQDAPKNWDSDVQIRIQGSRMLIKDSHGTEVDTKIVKHTKP